ncbi:MAG: AAA family ATPase [Dechloromonas sp.]|nr:MAG: AAA family ATPase [Dechloromonas sp.]
MTADGHHGAGEQAALVAALRNPACYPHPAGQVEVIETHISYVLLSGAHAYKIKKAVALGFLDFSTLARRRFFCEEELRLNRRLAPELYQAVVAITGPRDAPHFAGSGEAIEYAVQMARFPQEALLDRQLAAGVLSPDVIDQLADRLADFHERAERAPPDRRFGSPAAVWEPMAQNFAQLGEELSGAAHDPRLADLEAWSRQRFSQLADLLATRLGDGWIRECHGDLHLGNIVVTAAGLRVFDCIEFDPGLRWIDVLNEIAFLTMDLAERGRADYGHRLLNRYLEAMGDYRGLPLLAFYTVHRALVRAKVAAIRASQENPAERLAELANCDQYLDCAARATLPRNPRLLLMHGLAGSGKSRLAQQLLERLGALRIRSDVERKRLCGLPALAHSDSAVGDGIYDAAATTATYDRLVGLAEQILAAGYPVLVDAANLKVWQRAAFRDLAAASGVPFVILACVAPEAVLQSRLATRQAAGRDASEADQAVLAYQMRTCEAITPDEEACTFRIDTSAPFPDALPAALQDVPAACWPAPAR